MSGAKPAARDRPRCARRAVQQPFLPSVITQTGLDIHRYICSDWFVASLRRLTAPVGRYSEAMGVAVIVRDKELRLSVVAIHCLGY